MRQDRQWDHSWLTGTWLQGARLHAPPCGAGWAVAGLEGECWEGGGGSSNPWGCGGHGGWQAVALRCPRDEVAGLCCYRSRIDPRHPADGSTALRGAVTLHPWQRARVGGSEQLDGAAESRLGCAPCVVQGCVSPHGILGQLGLARGLHWVRAAPSELEPQLEPELEPVALPEQSAAGWLMCSWGATRRARLAGGAGVGYTLEAVAGMVSLWLSFDLVPSQRTVVAQPLRQVPGLTLHCGSATV